MRKNEKKKPQTKNCLGCGGPINGFLGQFYLVSHISTLREFVLRVRNVFIAKYTNRIHITRKMT